MIIGILQCETGLEKLSPALGDYIGLFNDLFFRCAPEVSLKVYDVEHGVYPATLTECDGYIASGSRRSVYESEPWILQLCDFIRELQVKQLKYVGICFGHQMIAQALGGRCEPAENGWGVGVKAIDIYSHEPWMKPKLEHCRLIVSHKDQVTVLPPGARVLGGNKHCPNTIIALGKNILGIQPHPEFTVAYARTLLDVRRNILGERLVAEAEETFRTPTDEATIVRWIVNFIAAA